jgi:hypothetical protein
MQLADKGRVRSDGTANSIDDRSLLLSNVQHTNNNLAPRDAIGIWRSGSITTRTTLSIRPDITINRSGVATGAAKSAAVAASSSSAQMVPGDSNQDTRLSATAISAHRHHPR